MNTNCASRIQFLYCESLFTMQILFPLTTNILSSRHTHHAPRQDNTCPPTRTNIQFYLGYRSDKDVHGLEASCTIHAP